MRGRELKPTGGLLARAKGRLAAHDDRRIERTILKGRCSVTDKPFDAVFERKRGGDDKIFRFKEHILPQKGGSTGGPSTVPTKLDVPIGEIALSSLGCPHCKSANPFHWVRCGGCNTFVCSGRSEQRPDGFYFRCAPSCGHQGFTGTLTRVDMHKPPKPTALQLSGKKSRQRLADQRNTLRITDKRGRK